MPSFSSAAYKIAVLGLGGVGGFLGGLLAQTLEKPTFPETRIFFLARGPHLSQIQAEGLVLNTPQAAGRVCRPTLATADARELPALDLVLVCVKSYHLLPVLEAIKPKVGAETVFLPLLNGVDVSERIRAVIPQGRVLPACIYVSSHVARPGVVTQEGGPAKIFFGPDPTQPDFSPEKVLSLFGAAGIDAQWLPDPSPAIWEKFFFIAPFSLVTAFSGEAVAEVAQDPELLALVRGIMREIAAVASRRGVHLAPALLESTLEKARRLPPDFKTSYQRDLEIAGHPHEGDLFGGTILRLGQQVGVETPVTSSLYQNVSARYPG